MNPSVLFLLSKSKLVRFFICITCFFLIGIIGLIYAFMASIGSVFVAVALDDTFYFPVLETTVPNERYDPNRVIVHEYEITVDVPVLDEDGLPMEDNNGNIITQPIPQTVREEIPSPHWGIDFDLPEQTYVVASRSGTVQTVSETPEDGKTVVIGYEDGWQTIYKHLNTTLVSAGQPVLMGQPIGQVGTTGSCTPYDTNHTFNLHFEMKDSNGNYLDPMTKLQPWGEYSDFPMQQIKEWQDLADIDVPPFIAGDGTHLVWPVPGYTRLSSDFGYRILNGVQNFHKGIDIPAPRGTPIYAAASGVVDTNVHSSYGIGLKIAVDGQTVHIYGHMTARAAGIATGTQVQAGQLIGYVGSTGQSTGNHLHFEVRINNRPTDPKPFFTD